MIIWVFSSMQILMKSLPRYFFNMGLCFWQWRPPVCLFSRRICFFTSFHCIISGSFFCYHCAILLFYLFIISLLIKMKDDESSILNNFLTPGYVNKASQRSTSNGRRRSVHKRIPIFSYTNNPKKNYFIFDHSLSNYEDRSLIDRKVINYDFCGCESQMTPCDIIMSTFLRKVKGEFLRLSYE